MLGTRAGNQYPEVSSCHHPGTRKGFIKCEALRLLRANSPEKTFEDNVRQFKQRMRARGYPDNLLKKIFSKDKFSNRLSAQQNNQEICKIIFPFVTEHRPSVPKLRMF